MFNACHREQKHGHRQAVLDRPQPGGASAARVPDRWRRGSYPARRGGGGIGAAAVSWAWLDGLQPVDADFLEGGRDQPPPQPRALFDAA